MNDDHDNAITDREMTDWHAGPISPTLADVMDEAQPANPADLRIGRDYLDTTLRADGVARVILTPGDRTRYEVLVVDLDSTPTHGASRPTDGLLVVLYGHGAKPFVVHPHTWTAPGYIAEKAGVLTRTARVLSALTYNLAGFTT